MTFIGAHSSLTTSAINVLGSLKKKGRKMMNNFAWAAKMLFEYLALHKRISTVSKASTNADTTV